MELVPASAGVRQEHIRDEPVAGTYWRARSDVPEKLRQVPYQQHHSLRDQGQPKILYRSEVERAALRAGTLLLLRTVHVIEGRVHSVVTSPDPNDPDDVARSWLVDEFLDEMEPVDEAEATAARNGDASKTLARIGELRDQMTQIASAASAESQSVRMIAPPSAEGPQALVKVQREAAEQRANALAKRAEEIGAVNVLMQGEVKKLGRLQGERADAALASVQDALKLAAKASEAVASLDLFGGNAVEVTKILDGDGAPDGTPVKIFQNRLFLDEELAVHLHVGGFSHRDLGVLGDCLARIPGLLDRLIPAQRGVVLVRIRRNAKAIDGTDFASVMAQIEDARADRTQFLLMRDGGRVHLTFAETALQEAERLFPTKDEMDKPFRGSGAENIGYQDVRYVKALKESERQALIYQRLLILLWGLEFSEERPLGRIDLKRDAGDWTSQAWQAEHLEFVSDDDTLSLPKAGPTVREWLAENRSNITDGSRIAIDWEEAIDADSAPSCAKRDWGSRSDRDVFTRRPIERYGIATVKMEGRDPIVMAPVQHVSTKTRSNARVNLRERESCYIVLDTVNEDELDAYAESRISRRDYLHYLALFRVAKEGLRSEMAEIAAIDAKIASELADAYRDSDAEAIKRAVKRAHTMLRAQQAGKPATGGQKRGVAETAAMILSGAPGAAELAKIAGVVEDDVLRSGIDGNGRARVVAPGPSDPIAPDGAWVKDIIVERTRVGGWGPPKTTVTTLERAQDPSIYVAHASPALMAVEVASRLPEGFAKLADSQQLVKALSAAMPDTIKSWHAPTADPAESLREWVEMTRQMTFGSKRPPGAPNRGVVTPSKTTVIAAIVQRTPSRKAHSATLLVAESDPIVDALIADPMIEWEMRRAFARIWKQGGGWKIDEAKEAARAIKAKSDYPFKRNRILVMQATGHGALARHAIETGNPHAYGYSDTAFCLLPHRQKDHDRANLWNGIASAAGMTMVDDPYKRDSGTSRNAGFRIVANRSTFQWMVDENDLGAPLLGAPEYHWIDA